MSRKGKLPIALPKGVEVKVSGNDLTVKGPKGTLHQTLIPGIEVKVEGNEIQVNLGEKHQHQGNMHGLYRSLVQNMVLGTTTGFETKLEMIGVGFRAAVQGALLDLQIGFSHPTKLPIPKDIQVKVDKNTIISVTGPDKQKVGQFAAEIRAQRPPTPYADGKGIRYEGEYVRKKAGKTAAAKK